MSIQKSLALMNHPLCPSCVIEEYVVDDVANVQNIVKS
jgi:hypothetical protein